MNETEKRDIFGKVMSGLSMARIPMQLEFAAVTGQTADSGGNRVAVMNKWRSAVNGVPTQTLAAEIRESSYFRDEDKFWRDLNLGLSINGNFA